jgi:DNA (cytosine-5)-methyltransferase 1
MRGENLNPSAATGPASRRKVMRATTKLINKIWSDYYVHHFPEDSKEGAALSTERLHIMSMTFYTYS